MNSKTPAPKYKIGFILDTSLDSTDGVQQYVLALGGWLAAEGHDVHYLVGETTRNDIPNVHSLSRNITVQFNGNRTTIPLGASKRRLKRFLTEQQFDILHVQTPHHPFLAQRIITAARRDTAIFATFHILPYSWLAKISTKLLGLLLKPSLRRIDCMLAVSPDAAEFEAWSFARAAEVLPNVIDYKRFVEVRPLPEYDDDVATILFLGRLVERKGCKTLLQAVAQLDRSELPPFRVVICGKGELKEHLEQFTSDNGLSDIVSFTGFVSEEDKPRYYASADLSVFPSSGGESFGIVLLEAMASGSAVVLAGDNPGYRSVMGKQPDLLFDPKNSVELAEKLAYYLQDKSEAQRMASWGNTYTIDFDVHLVGARLLNRYNQVLRHKRNVQ